MADEAQSGATISAIGDLTDLDAGKVFLPGFIERRPDGLFLDPAVVARAGGFSQFVERVFAAGARFVGLDYALFQALLYGQDVPGGQMSQLARDIVPFPADRRAYYRGLKIAPDKSAAEYLFEPIYADETASEPVRLDVDEFIAALWEKGVRFGIDVPLVAAALASPQSQRLIVARARPPTPGQDATLVEKTDALHRSDAPRIRPDGRMDLSQFKNRFPQVRAGVRLLQKIPRQLGRPGRNVAGEELEAPLPKDFDLALLAGPGTRIEQGREGEFVIAARDGFIDIDAQSNQISIHDKIINRDGVSMKTTGDVSLTGLEFEEHGEVQERRVVEGYNMTFHAAVYGRIVSRGGRIVLKDGIAGGSATSPGGSLLVEGRASQALLEARGGDIAVEHAEGCTIIASRIKVGRAVHCAILGEEVVVGVSEGSAIAARKIRIGESKARKDAETIVAVLVPDMSGFERDQAALEQEKQAAQQRIAAEEAKIAAMRADEEFAKYLALAATIAKGNARLSAEHEARWRETQARFAPQTRQWLALQQSLAKAQAQLASVQAELASLGERCAASGEGIGCAIAAVTGETLVRKMNYQPDQSIVSEVQSEALVKHLKELGASGERLFWAETGEFGWRADRGPCPPGEAF
ncbi:MAG: FapA family protein [Rhodocyclaceae bacterium]|nr:FapA family protein [Rhodocyclaceae bacterium]